MDYARESLTSDQLLIEAGKSVEFKTDELMLECKRQGIYMDPDT